MDTTVLVTYIILGVVSIWLAIASILAAIRLHYWKLIVFSLGWLSILCFVLMNILRDPEITYSSQPFYARNLYLLAPIFFLLYSLIDGPKGLRDRGITYRKLVTFDWQ